MADALDSGSSGSNPVRVQVPFSAVNQIPNFQNMEVFGIFCLFKIKKWGKSRNMFIFLHKLLFTFLHKHDIFNKKSTYLYKLFILL